MNDALHPPATRLGIGLTTTNGGHVFKPDSSDSRTIDILAYQQGNHNGPVCIQCQGRFCHHCEADVYEQKCPGKEGTTDSYRDRLVRAEEHLRVMAEEALTAMEQVRLEGKRQGIRLALSYWDEEV